MTRRERLEREKKIEVYIGEIAVAIVITENEMCRRARDLIYIGTDYEAIYDGKTVSANIYENEDGELFATII